MENALAKANEVRFDTTRLESIIRERKDAIALIGNVPEITRPIAIALWQEIRNQAMNFGLSFRESAEILTATRDMVIARFSISVYDAESRLVYELAEIGEAYADEPGNKKDTLARTAYTRAMKRALERLVGEDFINAVVMSVMPAKMVSEKQIAFIQSLAKKKNISDEKLLTGIQKLFGKEKLEDLTFDEASRLIERLKSK